MRALGAVAIVLACGALATPAAAARLVLPDSEPTPYSAYTAQAPQRIWDQQRPELQLREQPVGELIAAKLGFARGSAELFRYRLENGDSTRAQLDGIVDGAGIKLKLTW